MKTIDLKGKPYVMVVERIKEFHKNHTNGSIRTELLSPLDADTVVMKATVIPDVTNPEHYFTGYSQATWGDGPVNKTSALENCETSCVGRAMAMMGYVEGDSFASADEIKKAVESPVRKDTLKTLTSKVYQPAQVIGTLAKNEFTSVEGVKPTLKCMFCGVAINEKVSSYSIEKFKGKEICYDCQQKPAIKNAPSVVREGNDDDYDSFNNN